LEKIAGIKEGEQPALAEVNLSVTESSGSPADESSMQVISER
jgi:hypothetical protein